MADAAPIVHIGENSPEEVAYKLLGHIASAEGFRLARTPAVENSAGRQWILDTYAECVEAVKGYRSRKQTR